MKLWMKKLKLMSTKLKVSSNQKRLQKPQLTPKKKNLLRKGKNNKAGSVEQILINFSFKSWQEFLCQLFAPELFTDPGEFDMVMWIVHVSKYLDASYDSSYGGFRALAKQIGHRYEFFSIEKILMIIYQYNVEAVRHGFS